VQLCFGANAVTILPQNKKVSVSVSASAKREWGSSAHLAASFFSGLFQCRENFFAFGRTACELKVGRKAGGWAVATALGCGNSLGSESVASAGKASQQSGQQAATLVSVLQLPWVSIEHSLLQSSIS